MPLYTVVTQDGTVSDTAKAKIAEEVTRIHSAVMKVPRSFVRVVFLSYQKGSGFTAGQEAPTAALNCVLRSGHSAEEKTDMLKRLWAMFQALTASPFQQSRRKFRALKSGVDIFRRPVRNICLRGVAI
jgi:phenylpyruvate tautomerase PptA (4-oxalocrotonate tautomerase family)